MNPFPYDKDEWQRVNEAGIEYVNATLMDDDVLAKSRLIELPEILEELRTRHGNHPILLETEADFEVDPTRQKSLYEQAIQLAVACGLPTYTIRISLGRVFLDDFNDRQSARATLTACEDEVQTIGDDGERREWSELLLKC